MTDRQPAPEGHPAAPRTLRSHIAYAGGFLRVRLDEVELPSGREVKREVVEHPGAVGILALTVENEVLLVRQWRHAAGQELLEIPAGTREQGESVEETARRELIEEVGYEAGAVTTLLTFYPTPGYSNEQIMLVRADDCRPVERVADPDEGITLVKAPMADFAELIAAPDEPIRDGKTLIALQLALAAARISLISGPNLAVIPQ